MKLVKLIQEIGDSSLPPYPILGKEVQIGPLRIEKSESTLYNFRTQDGTDYQIILWKTSDHFDRVKYMVGFNNREKSGDYNWNQKSVNQGNQYRILATVVKLMNDEIKKDASEGFRPLLVQFNAHKEDGDDDNRRTNFYLQYVKKNLRNVQTFKVDDNGDFDIWLNEI